MLIMWTRILWVWAVIVPITLQVELEQFSNEEVGLFLKNFQASEVTGTCRSGLESVEKALNASTDLGNMFATAFAVGTSRDFAHISHGRWMNRSMNCQTSAGGGSFWDSGIRYEFCYAHTVSGSVIGICMPKECDSHSEQALEHWYQFTGGSKSEGVLGNLNGSHESSLSTGVQCVASRFEKQWYQKFAPMLDSALQVVLAALITAATVLGKRYKKEINLNLWKKLLLTFNLKSNLKKLMHAPSNPQSTVTCLFGLRSLSTVWTVLGHSYLVILPFLANLNTFTTDLRDSFFAQVITNFTLSTDSFFLLSGTLTAYAWFRKLKQVPMELHPSWRSYGYWLRFYRHRLVRLLPAYSYMIMSVVLRFSVTHFYPMWPIMDPAVQCKDCWWQNLLFLNTIFPDRCLPWTWYLANDFIFYLLSPIFLMALDKRRRLGIGLVIGVSTLSIILRAVLTAINNFPPTQFLWVQPEIFNPDFVGQHLIVYVKPHTRIGPYLVGILLGYFLCSGSPTSSSSSSTSSSSEKRPHPIRLALYWALSIVGGLWSVFGLYPALQGWKWTAYHLFFAGVHRTVFAIAVAWLIYACHKNYCALLNQFLSLRIWVFLGNLSYTCYLFHLLCISAIYLWFPFPIVWSGFSMHLLYLVLQLAFAYLAAFVCCITIELPFSNMEYILLNHVVFDSRKPSEVVMEVKTVRNNAILNENGNVESSSCSDDSIGGSADSETTKIAI